MTNAKPFFVIFDFLNLIVDLNLNIVFLAVQNSIMCHSFHDQLSNQSTCTRIFLAADHEMLIIYLLSVIYEYLKTI